MSKARQQVIKQISMRLPEPLYREMRARLIEDGMYFREWAVHEMEQYLNRKRRT
jgi:hypothetical protein